MEAGHRPPGQSRPNPVRYFFAVFDGLGASAFTAVATIELPSIRYRIETGDPVVIEPSRWVVVSSLNDISPPFFPDFVMTSVEASTDLTTPSTEWVAADAGFADLDELDAGFAVWANAEPETASAPASINAVSVYRMRVSLLWAATLRRCPSFQPSHLSPS